LLTHELSSIAAILKSGQPVIIPTDTVYGLALMVSENTSPEILFQIKDRPREKSIPWLIASFADFERYTGQLPDWAYRLARQYWPGALTLVCPAADTAAPAFVAEDRTLALRMPDHPLTLRLISLLEAPLATTSANMSGQAAVSRATDLDQLLVSRVAAVLTDPDETNDNLVLPSTIISCLGDRPVLLRQGALDLSDWLS
jgi:L-threonylcarbamoyladenylate synthase